MKKVLTLAWVLIRFTVTFIIVSSFLSLLLFLPFTKGLNVNEFSKTLGGINSICVQAIVSLLMTVHIYQYLRKIDKIEDNWLKIEFTSTNFFKLFKGIVFGFFYLGVFLLIFKISGGSINFSKGEFSWEFFLFYLLVIFVLAFFEEYLFRGYYFNITKHHVGMVPAIVISSIFFSFAHVFNPNIDILSISNIFGFGILLAVIYGYVKNLYFITGFHFGWNFLNIFLGFNVSGMEFFGLPFKARLVFKNNSLISGGQFGAEGSILTSIILIISIMVFLILLLNKKKEEENVFTGS